jgi:hypothetical protein
MRCSGASLQTRVAEMITEWLRIKRALFVKAHVELMPLASMRSVQTVLVQVSLHSMSAVRCL